LDGNAGRIERIGAGGSLNRVVEAIAIGIEDDLCGDESAIMNAGVEDFAIEELAGVMIRRSL
jgi:hypothetical protein